MTIDAVPPRYSKWVGRVFFLAVALGFVGLIGSSLPRWGVRPA